jgi:hypothetical protein
VQLFDGTAIRATARRTGARRRARPLAQLSTIKETTKQVAVVLQRSNRRLCHTLSRTRLFNGEGCWTLRATMEAGTGVLFAESVFNESAVLITPPMTRVYFVHL